MSRGVDAVAEWARDHLESWDRQQASYINRREDRFAVMLDVLAETVPEDALVVDLACGPGSISDRVLRRFPRMSCLAVDYDPDAARAQDGLALAEHGDRVTFREADLWDPTVIEALGGRRPARGAVLDRVALAAGEMLQPGLPARSASFCSLGGVLMERRSSACQLEGVQLLEELSRRDDPATSRLAIRRPAR